MKTFGYYPGCSLESTAKEYDFSIRKLCEEFDIGLKEIPDWNCCGASSGHFTDFKLSLALPARVLCIAESLGLDVVVPCPACFLRLRKTEYEFSREENTGLKEEILKTLGISYKGNIDSRHILEIFFKDIGIDKIRQKVKIPLTGLRVVSYYGCLLVRPPKLIRLGDPENPTMLDEIVEAIGAKSIDWPSKIDCCGGSLALSRPDLVTQLVDKIIKMARRAKADCIITACPLCQVNLDTRQNPKESIPVFYFTELIYLSLGIKDMKYLLKKHIVNPFSVLKSYL